MFCGCCELCAACCETLPKLGPACQLCAMPLPSGGICGRCIVSPPPFDRALAAFRYEFPVDRLIQQFKYAGRCDLVGVLGGALAVAARAAPLPQAILPVPLHPARQRQRGYNQAIQLARVVAGALGIELVLQLSQRIRNTAPQAGLDARSRRRNLRGAFAAKSANRWRHVALIDDVYTTGDTVMELANTLKRAGVGRVDVWVCARAI